MNTSCKLPCSMNSSSTKMMQILWKMRGSNSKMLQILLTWWLPLQNSKMQIAEMDRTKKRNRKSPETPSVLHRLGSMVSGFNRARGERTGKSSGNVVSPVPTLRPWHVQPSVWHPQNDSNAWIQRQIMTKTGANESSSGSKHLRAMNLRYVESKISKLHQSMHLLSKIHRGKPLLVLGGHLDQIWDCHRMPLGFQKQTIHNYPKKIIHVFGNFANENFESPRCFDLMPVLARKHIHILARCLVCRGFCQHIPLVHFQVNNLLALNIQHNGCHKPEQNMESRESLRKHEKTQQHVAVKLFHSCETLTCNALVWSAVSKTLLEDCCTMWQFCTTLLWDTLGIEDSCETLLWDTFCKMLFWLTAARLTNNGLSAIYSTWWPNNTALSQFHYRHV